MRPGETLIAKTREAYNQGLIAAHLSMTTETDGTITVAWSGGKEPIQKMLSALRKHMENKPIELETYVAEDMVVVRKESTDHERR
jgi:hypothetical protein